MNVCKRAIFPYHNICLTGVSEIYLCFATKHKW